MNNENSRTFFKESAENEKFLVFHINSMLKSRNVVGKQLA